MNPPMCAPKAIPPWGFADGLRGVVPRLLQASSRGCYGRARKYARPPQPRHDARHHAPGRARLRRARTAHAASTGLGVEFGARIAGTVATGDRRPSRSIRSSLRCASGRLGGHSPRRRASSAGKGFAEARMQRAGASSTFFPTPAPVAAAATVAGVVPRLLRRARKHARPPQPRHDARHHAPDRARLRRARTAHATSTGFGVEFGAPIAGTVATGDRRPSRSIR